MELAHDAGAVSQPAYITLRNELREMIVAGDLAPGTRLTIAEIAARFGVSQMPVREALQALHGEGLLELYPNRGARIRTVDERMVRNIYDLRGAIEGLVARLSLAAIEENVIATAEEINCRLHNAVVADDHQTVIHLNNQFHRCLYSVCDNKEALRLYELYTDLIGSLRRRHGFGNERLHSMVDQHKAVLLAYKMKDPVLIDHLVKSHCEGAKMDMLAHIKLAKETAMPKRGNAK